MLALKHLRGLSYEQTLKNVKESLILRQFCRLYFNPLPHKSTLIRWSQQISQETLVKFNQRLTQIATELQITKGRKMRTDGTVVATNIHFPYKERINHERKRKFRQARRWHPGGRRKD